MRVKNRIAVGILAAGVALSVSGCLAKEAEPRVPSAGGASNGQPQDDKAVQQKWVQCMHDEGQTDVKLTDQGIGVPGMGPGDEAKAEAMDKATEKCNAEVPGIQQLQDKPASAEQMQEARNFVKCMRENGVPAMADPDPKDRGALRIPADADQTAVGKAMGVCGAKYPGVAFAAEPAQ
jgi:hypothetical protein